MPFDLSTVLYALITFVLPISIGGAIIALVEDRPWLTTVLTAVAIWLLLLTTGLPDAIKQV